MSSLNIVSKHWEIVVEVGNDWGEPSYIETREHKDREEVDYALETLNYYDIILSIKEVVVYELNNKEDESDE